MNTFIHTLAITIVTITCIIKYPLFSNISINSKHDVYSLKGLSRDNVLLFSLICAIFPAAGRILGRPPLVLSYPVPGEPLVCVVHSNQPPSDAY